MHNARRSSIISYCIKIEYICSEAFIDLLPLLYLISFHPQNEVPVRGTCFNAVTMTMMSECPFIRSSPSLIKGYGAMQQC